MKPRARHPESGFTLIEILVAMFVLAFGLTAVIGLVYGTTRSGIIAGDRNVAAMIATEAIASIERTHLVTQTMITATGSPQSDINLFVETIQGSTSSPNLNPHISNSSGSYFPSNMLLAPAPYDTGYTAMWPQDASYYGGPINDGSRNDPTSNAYRVIYRLERDVRWHPHPSGGYDPALPADDDSPFAGVYTLTLAVYRDINRKGTKLEQVCDPMVVYLRDKKVR